MTRSTQAMANGMTRARYNYVTALFALEASQDKTKSFFALTTQQSRTFETTLVFMLMYLLSVVQ